MYKDQNASSEKGVSPMRTRPFTHPLTCTLVPLCCAVLLGACGLGRPQLSATQQARFDTLLKALDSVEKAQADGPHEQASCPAIDKLIRLNAAAARDAFRDALHSPKPTRRFNGAVGLVRMKDPSGADELVRAATDATRPPHVRASALRHLAALHRQHDHQVFESILTQVHDPPLPEAVVGASIEGWAAWPQRVDQEVILDRLEGADGSTRRLIYRTLTKLEPSILPEQAMIDADSANRDLREAAIQYAAACEDPRALDVLRSAVRDGGTQLQLVAAEALADRGSVQDADAIATLTTDSTLQVARRAVDQLRKLEAAEALAGCLQDRRWQIRARACNALGKLGPKALTVWDRIAPAATDRSIVVRLAVADAAAATGDPAVVPTLAVLVRSGSALVRRRAAAAAGRITGLTVELPDLAGKQERAEAADRLMAWLKQKHPELVGESPFVAPQPLTPERRRTLTRLLAQVGGRSGPVDEQTIQQLRKLGPAAIYEMESEPQDSPLWTRLRDDVLGLLSEVYRHLGTLRNGQMTARRQAALALAELGKQAAFSPRARLELALVLRRVDDYFVFRYVLRCIHEPPATQKHRSKVAEALDASLAGCLQHGDPRIRTAAAVALGRRRAADSVDALIRALQDDRSAVVAAAAGALGRIGEPRATAHLLLLLTRRNPHVRLAAAISLCRLGVLNGRRELVHQLHGGSTPLVLEAVDYLAESRSHWGTVHLIGLLAHANTRVQAKAVDALRAITGEQFGYSPTLAAAQRRAAIARWQQWWSRQPGAQPIPALRPKAPGV
jgi:HEAT repeat protein